MPSNYSKVFSESTLCCLLGCILGYHANVSCSQIKKALINKYCFHTHGLFAHVCLAILVGGVCTCHHKMRLSQAPGTIDMYICTYPKNHWTLL